MAGWSRASRRGTIRKDSRRRRSICRPGAPGGMAREIFLDELKADAAVLPRIVALGDIDEDELAFAEESEQYGGAAPLDIPPKLGELERRLTLARLVAAWAKGPVLAPLVVGGPASTLALAGDLARLMDDMVTRGVGWEALDGLVPDQLDQYWQHSLDFLRIARQAWPAHLQEIGRIEPAARRDLLIAAEARRLSAHHDGPVIAAGSTGSMPATAKFLHAVGALPQGAVVLPGLDTDLDEEAWQTIGGVRDAQGKFTAPPSSNHPQFAMHALLTRFGIKRGDVEILATLAPHGREVLASEAMRPSNATAQWHRRLAEPDIVEKISGAMENLAVIAADNPEMEALAIAVAMREARHLDQSAALVTPDRALARRVIAALGRWNLAFDDSGGDALMDTPAGIFARLAAEAAANELEPPTLLALLKHPLCRLGGAAGAFRDAVETLELALLRGTRPQAAGSGLARDFARFRDELAKLRRGETSSLHGAEPRTRLSDEELDRAQALIAALQAALAPLESSLSGKTLRLCRARHPPSRSADGAVARRAWRRPRLRGPAGVGAGVRLRRSARRENPKRPACRTRRLSGSVPDRLCRPHGAAAGTGRCSSEDIRPAGSAADAIRPRHHRRAGRGRVAAGAAGRSLAEPADAARTRPRSAGTAHRPFRARFRAIARRRRSHPQSRGQGRRRAGGGLALPAPAGSGRGRGALERRRRRRREICALCRRAGPPRQSRADPAARAEAAARDAAA